MMSTILLDHHAAARHKRNSILRIFFTDIADDKNIVMDISESISIYEFHRTERKKEKSKSLC